jgi:hypothetical protein
MSPPRGSLESEMQVHRLSSNSLRNAPDINSMAGDDFLDGLFQGRWNLILESI